MWRKAVFIVLCSFSLLRDGISYSRFKRQEDSADLNLATEFFNNCSCVLYYQCDDQGLIITSGEGLFDPRLGDKNGTDKRIKCNGGKFEGELVCCKYKPGEENKPPVTTNSTTTTTTVTATRLPNRKRNIPCGRQRPVGLSVRVSSGDEDLTPLEGEFPWLAAIYRKDSSSTEWKQHKAGSLIHPKVVMTAGHVVGRSKPNELKVIVNGQIVLTQIGGNEVEERNVEEIVKHPEFSSGTLYYDVALLILEEPYNISTIPTINSICLRPEISYENKICFVAGWGKTSTQDTTTSDILRKVPLTAHFHNECQEMLRKTRLGSGFLFHKSFLCAGGEEGKDACKGDGGSPLVCPTGANDTMYQVGIVAFGVGCGMKDVPGIYANVAHFHSWIVKELKDRNINI